MKNVNRAVRNASDADRADREYRGVGRASTARRKVAARRAHKAIASWEKDSQD